MTSPLPFQPGFSYYEHPLSRSKSKSSSSSSLASRGRLRMNMSKASQLSRRPPPAGGLAVTASRSLVPRSSPLTASMGSLPTLNSLEARREEIQREYQTLKPHAILERRQQVLDRWEASGGAGAGGDSLDETMSRQRQFNSSHRRAPNVAEKVTKSPYRTRQDPAVLPMDPAKQPAWLRNDRSVLRYFMYFQEGVPESATEAYRIHKCVLLYYLADDTMAIKEPPQDSSGIPQGDFLKRGVYYPAVKGMKRTMTSSSSLLAAEPQTSGSSSSSSSSSSRPFQPGDFLVGSDISIIGRTFHVVDADAFTREYMLEAHGFGLAPRQPYPEDPFYDSFVAERAANRNPLRSHMVDNAAIEIGRPSLQAKKDTLAQYKAFDGVVLRFYAIWDTSKKLYGETRKYTVNYFLSDDTVEVRESHEKNSGRDPFPYMLKRNRLPRDWQSAPHVPDKVHGRNAEKYLTEDDFRCGQFINVFGRQLLLTGCDKFTREWFAKRGVAQEPIEYFVDSPVRPKKRLPPYNGYGSEADSLANCVNLIPKRTHTDLRLFLKYSGMVCKFHCKMVDCDPPDDQRNFLVTFYLEDDTLSIYEPPVRNTGIVGGKFLARGKYKLVGARKTAAEMPKKRTEHEQMLYDRIMQRLSSGGSGLMRAFKHFGKSGGGGIDLETFKHGCQMVGLIIPDEAKEALFRGFDEDGSGHLDFSEFIEHVLRDSHGICGAEAAPVHCRNARASDFQIGKKFRLLFPENGNMTCLFKVSSCDRLTAKLIEENPELFPASNVQAIVNLMPARLGELGVKPGRVFKELDHHGRGYITLDQFRQKIADWALDLGFVAKPGLTDPELDVLVNHFNANADEKIEGHEFQEAFSTAKEFQDIHEERVQSVEGKIFDLLKKSATEGGAKEMFQQMDTDNNGKVTFKEFKKFLAKQGYLLNEREKAYIMLTYDRDGDGCIEYEEFARRGQKGSDLDVQLNEEQQRRLDEGINSYMDILKQVEDEEDTGKLLDEIVRSFSAAYKTRRRLLRQNFLRFDKLRKGLVGA